MALVFEMESTERRAREVITTKDSGEQTVMTITVTFTGKRGRLAPGWWTKENPLKPEKPSSEPLLEEEETCCPPTKAGSMWTMGRWEVT